jgi:hypothetical protein
MRPTSYFAFLLAVSVTACRPFQPSPPRSVAGLWTAAGLGHTSTYVEIPGFSGHSF